MKNAVVFVSYDHHLYEDKEKLEEKHKTSSKEGSVMDVKMVTP